MGFKCNLIVFGLKVMVPSRVRENFSYPNCPLDKHYIKFGCLNPRVLVQKVLPGS